MAYLDTVTLTCPSCGLSAAVEVVIGKGPGLPKGATPSRTVRAPALFLKESSVVTCPTDHAVLWRDRATVLPAGRAAPATQSSVDEH